MLFTSVHRENVLWHCYGIADAILFGENQGKKNGVFRFEQCFQWAFDWNPVTFARIIINIIGSLH